MANAKRMRREIADDWTPKGRCSFCGELARVVGSETTDARICESCADGAICAFLNGKEARHGNV
jgi:hypothetical protein